MFGTEVDSLRCASGRTPTSANTDTTANTSACNSSGASAPAAIAAANAPLANMTSTRSRENISATSSPTATTSQITQALTLRVLHARARLALRVSRPVDVGRHVIDQPLHCTEQRRLQVGVAAHPAQHPPPHLLRVGDPERGADAFLPGLSLRHVGPGPDADRRGFHRLPDVDVRMAGDQHVRGGHGGDYPAFLASVDQVVDEDAEL